MTELHDRILKLRKRLLSLHIEEVARPANGTSSGLPSQEQTQKMKTDFSGIVREAARLPDSADQFVDADLDLLREEIKAFAGQLERVEQLAALSGLIQVCDAVLSDLLEHIDSYPAPPLGPLSSSYEPSLNLSPSAQLSARLSFTKAAVEKVSVALRDVADDVRAVAEYDRLLQTWNELQEMANDRITGKKSRPSSVISSGPSSGRTSSASSIVTPNGNKKANGYANLSLASATRNRLLPPSSRRAASSSDKPTERSSSSARTYNRSTSGPLNFSMQGTTFASRQRTTSLTPASATPVRRPSGPLLFPGSLNKKRSESPSISNASSYTHSNAASTSRSSTSVSTWSRAPRISFATPAKKTPPRKNYVANPKNKLDVAVGDVVNNLPVGINIESVSGSWKDQSGKYWIGDQDPKLCFCRILRSQTVMVRVGGGWMELSKCVSTMYVAHKLTRVP